MNLDNLIKKIIKESTDEKTTRYMFFSNLEQMRRQCDLLLELDPEMVESILENGHDWAQDHIAAVSYTHLTLPTKRIV